MDNSLIAAIDIGTTKIVVLSGTKNSEGKFEILGFGTVASKGIRRGAVLNIEEAIESIKRALEIATQDSGQVLNEVYVGIAGQHIRSIKTKTSTTFSSSETEISMDELNFLKNKVKEIHLDGGEEILHIIPQTYSVDSELGVKNPIGMFGKEITGNYHVVIAQMSSISNIKRCVTRASLKVNDLILEPLASSAAVLSNDEKEVGVALVDIGGGTSDVAVFHDGVLVHTAVIPMGGNLITSDIKSAYNILERQAEELKLQYGSAIPEKTQEGFIITIPGLKGRPPKQISLVDLNMIIKARVEEIVHAVKFQIELSQKEDQLGAGIVICGGGALLKNIRQLISHLTNYDVRIGYSTEHLSSNVVEEINQPQFATSLGLIMKAYEMQNENNNVKSKLGLQETKQEAETEQEVEEVETRKKSKRQKTKRQKQGDESSSNLIDKLKDKMSRLFEEDEDVEDL